MSMKPSVWECELTRRTALAKSHDERMAKASELYEAATRQEQRGCRQAADYLRDLASIWGCPAETPFIN